MPDSYNGRRRCIFREDPFQPVHTRFKSFLHIHFQEDEEEEEKENDKEEKENDKEEKEEKED